MLAQYERRVTEETSKKALRLLEKAGNPLPEIGNNIYTYFLTIRDNTGNDLSIDALLRVNKCEIIIFVTWEMIYDTQTEMLKAQHIDGEKGLYSQALVQKYINAFLILVENVDIDSLTSLKVLAHGKNNAILV